MLNTPRPQEKPRTLTFYVILGAVLFAFIQAFALLSSILLSFLLIYADFTRRQSCDLPNAGVQQVVEK
jgi:hypothetical protein